MLEWAVLTSWPGRLECHLAGWGSKFEKFVLYPLGGTAGLRSALGDKK